MGAFESRLKKLEERRKNRKRKFLAFVWVNEGQTQLEATLAAGYTEADIPKLSFVRWLWKGEAGHEPLPTPLSREVMGRIPMAGPPPDADPTEADMPTAPVPLPDVENRQFWRRIIPTKQVY